jgi:uncharacterized glyoxalase superfamily protein PhnB
VTPCLAVSDAAAAIAWYKKAFDARELMRMPAPDGRIMHAELLIGGSRVMLSDVVRGSELRDPQTLGGTTANLHVYHRAVDRLWQQAVAAGAQVTMPLDDRLWGDRYGRLVDPFGHSWALAYKAKVGRGAMERRRRAFLEMFAAGGRV